MRIHGNFVGHVHCDADAAGDHCGHGEDPIEHLMIQRRMMMVMTMTEGDHAVKDGKADAVEQHHSSTQAQHDITQTRKTINNLKVNSNLNKNSHSISERNSDSTHRWSRVDILLRCVVHQQWKHGQHRQSRQVILPVQVQDIATGVDHTR